MSAAQTSTNNGSNDAPVVSGPIHHIHLGYIGRWDEERGDYEPTDEALIFLNDDNEQTCHVEGPNAKAMAAFIVRACNSHDALVKALKEIAALDGPAYRSFELIKRARHIAKCALSARGVQ